MLIVFCYQAQSSGQWGHPCQLIILKVAVAQSVIMLGRICSWQTWSSLWHECTPLVSALRSPISLPGLRELVVFVLLKNQTTLVQLSRKVRQKKIPRKPKKPLKSSKQRRHSGFRGSMRLSQLQSVYLHKLCRQCEVIITIYKPRTVFWQAQLSSRSLLWRWQRKLRK